MSPADAAALGLVQCKHKPRTWHMPRAPRCDCGACCYARGAGKRVPHTRCWCAARKAAK